jgi:hypothetical protein
MKPLVLVLMALAPAMLSAMQQPGSQEEKFLLAVRKGDAATVKTMLAAGFNPNTKYRYDRMALSFACDRGNVEVVKALLEAGADVNAADSFYQATAMDWALNKGHIQLATLLLDHGAKNSERILLSAVSEGNIELLKSSLARGGLPAESIAAALSIGLRNKKPEIVEALRAAGAKPVAEVAPELLDKYAGTYRAESGQGQELTFTHKDGRLEGGPPGQNLVLLPLDTSTFRPEQFAGITIRFNVDGNGNVTGATLKQGTNETIYKRAGADAKQ